MTLKDETGVWKEWDDGLQGLIQDYFQTLFTSKGL